MNKNVLKIIDSARFVNTPNPPSQDEILEKIVLETARQCIILCRNVESWSANNHKLTEKLVPRATMCIHDIEKHFGLWPFQEQSNNSIQKEFK